MIEQFVNKHLLEFKNYTVPDNQYNIVLNANESPYNIFDYVKDEVLDSVNQFNPQLYPDAGAQKLRKRLSEYIQVPESQIICGNGSDEIISMIFNAFVDTEDVVVTHAPTFDMYDIGTKISKGRLIPVQDDENFKINVDGIIEQVNENNAKLLFICVPNNPTGYVIPKEEIIRILNSTNCIVVIDEAYCEFYGISCIDLIDIYPNIIVLRTLSKAFGMAGLRVGYGVGSKEIIDWLYKLKQPYNLNSMSQILATIVLEHKDKIQLFIEKIVKERIRLYDTMQGFNNLTVFPSSSNFILVKSSKSKIIYNDLLKSGILIKYYGDHSVLKDCMRLTVGKPNDNDSLLRVIEEAVK